jgi:hypothetical protein
MVNHPVATQSIRDLAPCPRLNFLPFPPPLSLLVHQVQECYNWVLRLIIDATLKVGSSGGGGPRNSDTLKLGRSEIRKHDKSDPQNPGDSEFRKLEIQKLDSSGSRRLGGMDTQKLGNSDTQRPAT